MGTWRGMMWLAPRASEAAVGIFELFGLRILDALRIDADGGDCLVLKGTVAAIDLDRGNGVNDLKALGDLAEGRILLVKMRGVLVR